MSDEEEKPNLEPQNRWGNMFNSTTIKQRFTKKSSPLIPFSNYDYSDATSVDQPIDTSGSYSIYAEPTTPAEALVQQQQKQLPNKPTRRQLRPSEQPVLSPEIEDELLHLGELTNEDIASVHSNGEYTYTAKRNLHITLWVVGLFLAGIIIWMTIAWYN